MKKTKEELREAMHDTAPAFLDVVAAIQEARDEALRLSDEDDDTEVERVVGELLHYNYEKLLALPFDSVVGFAMMSLALLVDLATLPVTLNASLTIEAVEKLQPELDRVMEVLASDARDVGMGQALANLGEELTEAGMGETVRLMLMTAMYRLYTQAAVEVITDVPAT